MEHVPRPLIAEYEIPKYEGDLGHPNLFVPLTPAIADARSSSCRSTSPPSTASTGSAPRRSPRMMALRGVEAGDGLAEAFHVRKW